MAHREELKRRLTLRTERNQVQLDMVEQATSSEVIRSKRNAGQDFLSVDEMKQGIFSREVFSTMYDYTYLEKKLQQQEEQQKFETGYHSD